MAVDSDSMGNFCTLKQNSGLNSDRIRPLLPTGLQCRIPLGAAILLLRQLRLGVLRSYHHQSGRTNFRRLADVDRSSTREKDLAPKIGKDARHPDFGPRRALRISHVHPRDQRASGGPWVCLFVDRAAGFDAGRDQGSKKEKFCSARALGHALLHPAVFAVVATIDQWSGISHADAITMDLPIERVVELVGSVGDFRMGAIPSATTSKWTERRIDLSSIACQTEATQLNPNA